MQKKWPLVLGFVIVALATFWFFKSPSMRPESSEEAHTGEKTAAALSYATEVLVKQRVEGQGEATVIDIRGVLDQASDLGSDYLSQWSRIDQFTLMNQAQDQSTIDTLINKSVNSHYVVGDNAFAHFFQTDFPRDFVPFHASLFHRTLLPVKYETLKRDGKLTTKERDEVGEYDALYTVQGNQVIKQWMRYHVDSIKVDRKANQFVYTFREDGKLEAVRGDLILHYRQSTPTRFQIVIDMKLVGPTSHVVAKVDNKTALAYSEADIAKGVEGNPQSTLPFDEALKRIDTITDQSDSSEAFRIFSSLKFGLDQDPSRAKDVIAKIEGLKERDPSSRRKLSVLFGALAQAKDMGISTSLADLAETCPDNFCKIQAIAGVNSHPNPSGEALDKMLSLADRSTDAEISGNALLAAGAAGSRIEGPAPELSETLLKTVNDPAKTAIKPAAIAAMGNHGSSEYLPVLQKNLNDPSSTIRSAAAYSMRYVPDPSVDKSLISVLSTEKDQTVLRDALKALDYRSLSADDYATVAEKTAKIIDTETQKIGARILVQAYREDPSLVENAIADMKKQLKDGDVKEYLATEVEKIKADRAAAQTETDAEPAEQQ